MNNNSEKKSRNSSSPKNCARWPMMVVERLAAIPFNGTSINCVVSYSSLFGRFLCVENVDLLLKNGHNLSAATHTDFQHPNYMAFITVFCLTRILCVFFVFCCFIHSFFPHFTYILLREWRREKKKNVRWPQQKWLDETSQKGCDLSLNHLTLYMANGCVYMCACFCTMHVIIHTPIKICSKLIRYGNLFCVVCDTCLQFFR